MEIVKLDFTEEQVKLIKQQLAPNATHGELQMFLHQCKRTGLDPLTRQIYCIHRGGKMSIQTSIDGFRVIAERSGQYAGQDEPVFTYDGEKIVKCSVTVYKFNSQGQRYPAATGVAYWAEYAQNSPMWTKMKHTMLSKCAEALALRKAFPQDLSGLYTGEEMAQADPVQDTTYEEVPDELSNEDRDYLHQLLNTSTYENKVRQKLSVSISAMRTQAEYEKAKVNLLGNQLPPESTPNMSAKDVNRTVKNKVEQVNS